MTVVLPEVEVKDTDDLMGVFEDEIYYRVERFPVHRLLEPDFLESFVKKGNLEGRTVGTWNDIDECAILNSGTLKLSVGKDVYQSLGLAGQPELILGRQVAKYCK